MDMQKNYTLELLKLFASYMVVFIHVIFSGYIGTAIETLARFAVPFFFLISGFYSYRISLQKIKKRIKKILFLIVFAAVSYTLFNILLILSNSNLNDVWAYLGQYLDFNKLVNLFVFNAPVCIEYLWYLYAMLYVYVVFYFATKFDVNDKVILAISISILILHILLGEILSVFGILLPGLIVRNFVAMGIPFFSLGLLAKKYQDKFLTIPDYVILISGIVGALESIFSRYFFEKKELYIGSVFILFAFVCVFIKYSDFKYPKIITSLVGCSTYIYIFHDMVSKVIRKVYLVLSININSSVFLENLHPIIVCVVSTIVAYLLNKLLKSLKKHKSKVQLFQE